jgi:hypothetical protein
MNEISLVLSKPISISEKILSPTKDGSWQYSKNVVLSIKFEEAPYLLNLTLKS